MGERWERGDHVKPSLSLSLFLPHRPIFVLWMESGHWNDQPSSYNPARKFLAPESSCARFQCLRMHIPKIYLHTDFKRDAPPDASKRHRRTVLATLARLCTLRLFRTIFFLFYQPWLKLARVGLQMNKQLRRINKINGAHRRFIKRWYSDSQTTTLSEKHSRGQTIQDGHISATCERNRQARARQS